VYALIRSYLFDRRAGRLACIATIGLGQLAPPAPARRAPDSRFPKRRKTMLRNKWLAGTVLAGLLAVSGAAQAAGVSFVQPADGATVSNPVHVVFGVAGMKIAPAGTMTEGTGHHHLLIDGKPLPKGEVIPATDKSLHFGKGQTETDLTLPPGDHTLTLQFGDGAHRSYGPEMSKTITVHVK
jgi:hypothetical protein